jgi:hypothetical protein
MSVGKACDEGHRVVFEACGGYIVHVESGQRTQFERLGVVFVLDVEVEPLRVSSIPPPCSPLKGNIITLNELTLILLKI